MTNAPNWDRIKAVFQEALDQPPDARLARVRALCGDDDLLFAEVASLLATHDQVGSFAERPAEELLKWLTSEDHYETVAGARTLPTGTRLGVYEILELVGAGGMGEVYTARDTRLDRVVAIKVLLAHAGADRRARDRFDREARAVAALSHPNICTLHDLGHDAGIDFLVMEHLVGETLAARLARGPVPLDQALTVAVQIASALDVAHRVGIVHRDLKPGNIFLVRGGGGSGGVTAKLLDFGLAKAYDPVIVGGASREAPPSELTTPGAILGTVQYMAPEQVQGKAVDARTDIFAFGAVLHELICGRRPFIGDTETDVIAAILGHEPPLLSSVRPDVPAALDRIVATSLAKDPDDRWQSARDLLRALTWLRDGTLTGPSGVPRSPRNTRAWLAAAAVLIAAIGVGASFWIRPAPAPTAASVSFSIQAPEGTKFPRGTAEMAISPDGTRLVFVALEADGRRRLWIREFDSVNARVINGTDGARYPFWSPDSSAIGFFVRGTLKRIAEAGGESVYVCDAEWGLGGTWNSDGTILFGGSGPIRRVSATGGTSAPVTSLEESRQERSHAWPVFLGDGRRFLYLALTNVAGQTTVYQGSLDSTEKRPVLATESNVGISGTQLFWYSNGSLLVQTYDGDRAAMVGQPVTVADHIRLDTPLRSGGAFAVGTSGALAFRSASPDSRLVWVDRQGRELSTFPTRADYQNPWLSPDEKRLAIEKTDPSTGRHAIWILDLERGTTSRLLFDASGAHGPGWSPDGSRIVFASNRLGGVDLYAIRSDGAGGESLLVSSPDKYGFVLNDWSRDGRLLLFQTNRQADLGTLLLAPGERPRPILDSVAVERHGQFSPDTKWIAYSSDESGTPEVYVRRFPSGEGKWQISTHGGAQPRWRRDAKELFYLAPDGNVMAVDITIGAASLESSIPRPLFATGITTTFVDRTSQYLPTRDGQRFLLNISAEEENSAPITVVMNWQIR